MSGASQSGHAHIVSLTHGVLPAQGEWVDLRLALSLDCVDGDQLASDWWMRGAFPGILDVPYYSDASLDPVTGTLELQFQETPKGPTVEIAGHITTINNAEDLKPGPALSEDAIARIKHELTHWVGASHAIMLEDAKTGYIELRGRPNSLFALDQPIPPDVLPYLDGINLRDGTVTLNNGEIVYSVKARLAPSQPAGRSPEIVTILDTLKTSPVVRPRLRWLISAYQQGPLPKRAPDDHRKCEADLSNQWNPLVSGPYKAASIRSFGKAKTFYRFIQEHDLWTEAAKIPI